MEQAEADGAFQREDPGEGLGSRLPGAAQVVRKRVRGQAVPCCGRGTYQLRPVALCGAPTLDSASHLLPAVNTGQFVLLPTPASLAFVERWAAKAPTMIELGLATQAALDELHGEHAFHASTSLCECLRTHRDVRSPAAAASDARRRKGMAGLCSCRHTPASSSQWLLHCPCSSRRQAGATRSRSSALSTPVTFTTRRWAAYARSSPRPLPPPHHLHATPNIVRSPPTCPVHVKTLCTVGSPDWIGRVDPCDWSTLFLHPICTPSAAAKTASLRAAGFWFVDSEHGGRQRSAGGHSALLKRAGSSRR